MKIAVPVAAGRLCLHFGHCQHFAMFDVDEQSTEVGEPQLEVPPPHAPGVLPRWLGEQKVNLVLAGGMGWRAKQLFEQAGVEVVSGAPAIDPREVVQQYLADSLELGANPCDHGSNDHGCSGH